MRQQLYYSDLLALVGEFQTLVGSRLQKVYNIGASHLYLLKFQLPAGKVFLGLQPGKFVIQLQRPPEQRPKIPSSFCQKLRRHLGNCRLTQVEILRGDRIVSFTFGSGQYVHHLVVELYGEGNVILTNSDHTILSMVRPLRYAGQRMRVQTDYRNYLPPDRKDPNSPSVEYPNNPPNLTSQQLSTLASEWLRNYGRDISTETEYRIRQNPATTWSRVRCQQHLDTVLTDLTRRQSVAYQYRDMCNPIAYQYCQTEPIVAQYRTFNEALEHYLDRYLTPQTPSTPPAGNTPARSKTRTLSQKQATMVKIYQQKVSGLQAKITKLTEQIQYLTDHPDQVTKQLHQANQDPDLLTGKERLYCWETGTNLGKVTLRGTLSYYDNLGILYRRRKDLEQQIQKTHLGHQRAQRNFQTKPVAKKRVPARVTLKTGHWYHNFHWFVTSNGYLVVCGKNSGQNETVVKKYLEDHDLYLHSEVAGCGSGVLKVPPGRKPEDISPVDLEEAGAFVVCLSRAWRDRVPDRAYWTTASQVSKTTETGEYVQTGSFIVRGKRNYSSQIRLELGLTLYQGQLMLAPYRRLASLPASQRLKLTPGRGKRNQGLQRIIQRFQLASTEKSVVDSIVPHQSIVGN